jgi:UDP-N-acetylmuramate dehydrogenase
MNITKNKSLLEYNTLKVNAFTRYFAQIKSEKDLLDLMYTELFSSSDKLILGGGSNILFTKSFDGLIIHSEIDSIQLVEENENSVSVNVGSGVEWDSFVQYCVQNNWYGIENLSDIPGKVGAAPVQNIGAYGVEAKDNITKVFAWNLINGEKRIFSNRECKFGYRYSIFKEEDFKNYFITHVTFQLNKRPDFKINYGSIKEELKNYKEHSIHTLRKIIIDIRQSKLPSGDKFASAGSFFKNPIVEKSISQDIRIDYPDLPEYKVNDLYTKIPAAWLIERSGLKGFSNGKVGTYELQPLVIINYGQASGKEIAEFAQMIQATVKKKFNISLEPEVCII